MLGRTVRSIAAAVPLSDEPNTMNMAKIII